MGLGNVILLQGRELEVENSAEMRAPGESGSENSTLWPRNTRKQLFFFFFLQRSVENANKTNLVL